MTWTAYQVTFRLLSPVHIGWHKLGNLQQTRPYITGRNLWGALTARLTRQDGNDNYKVIGEQVDAQLAFTYFYPSTKQDTVELWPWRDERDNWDMFAWTFLGSYASTALEDGRGAQAGSLHETEFIASNTRDGEPVYLVGYFFKKDTCQLLWEKALGKLQFGGERGYGWGRVELVRFQKCEEANPVICFGYEFKGEHAYPLLQAPKAPEASEASKKDRRLLAHTYADNADDARGTIEPLIGRETTGSTSFGKSISRAEICWTPGSKARAEEKFYVEQKGIWRRVVN
jgi:hypothetical protein